MWVSPWLCPTGGLVWLRGRQQRKLAPLLGEQPISGCIPKDGGSRWRLRVQRHDYPGSHQQNPHLQGEMMLRPRRTDPTHHTSQFAAPASPWSRCVPKASRAELGGRSQAFWKPLAPSFWYLLLSNVVQLSQDTEQVSGPSTVGALPHCCPLAGEK